MVKVLYISHLLEQSGSGEYSRHNARALKAAGVDVVCRPMVLGKPGKVDSDIEDMITKSPVGADIVVQSVLPHHMMYQGGVKNIGMALVETHNFTYNAWPDYLNLMDEVWVPNQDGVHGVTKPQQIIPLATDITKYDRKYPKMKIDGTEGRYKFYTICEYSKRKNIWATVWAYYREFLYDDMVCLIFKVHQSGKSPQDLQAELQNHLVQIQSLSGLYPNSEDFPPVIFITERWPEEQVMGLHQYCDCYVSTSFGEAWNYPFMDACGFGNMAIGTRTGGMKYMSERLRFPSILVEGTDQPCLGAMKQFIGYNTMREDWVGVDVNKVSQSMRIATGMQVNTKADITQLSYENVGNRMLERLLAV